MFEDPFKKRTVTVAGLLVWLWQVAARLPALLAVYVHPRKPEPAFRERIMLAVTEANDCRYCRYIHGGWAEAAGVDLEHAFEGTDAERAAFAFAGEVAEKESLGGAVETRPDLEVFYDPATVRRIEAITAAIMAGNLAGNTLDAFIERLGGGRPPSLRDTVNEAAIAIPAALFLASAALLMNLLRFLGRPPKSPWGGIQ